MNCSAQTIMLTTSAPNFASRHLGPSPAEVNEMLRAVGADSLDALVNEAIPAYIRLRKPLDLPAPASEHEALAELKAIMARNNVSRSYIGMGYYDCFTPPVVQRN